MDKEQSKSAKLQLRCTPEFKENLRIEAEAHQMDSSEFVRYLFHTYKEFIKGVGKNG